jgi:hypothetical protein
MPCCVFEVTVVVVWTTSLGVGGKDEGGMWWVNCFRNGCPRSSFRPELAISLKTIEKLVSCHTNRSKSGYLTKTWGSTWLLGREHDRSSAHLSLRTCQDGCSSARAISSLRAGAREII